MAFVAGRRQYDIEDTSQDVTVASSPWARLMYYLDCVNSCIKDDENIIPYALRNHERYYALSNDEKAAIVKICTELLRIDHLVGKVFFLAKDLDGSGNKFYKLTQTTDLLALGIHADSVIGIGGSSKEVTTIMLMTEHWMNRNFLQALREAGNSLSYGANSSYGSVGMISYAAPPATVYKVPSRRCGAKNKTLKKNKKWLFALFLGVVILGYIAATFTPSYLAQHNAYALPDVSEWKNNVCFLLSFIHSFCNSFIHSSILQFIHSFIHSAIHSAIHSFCNSFILQFIHSFCNSFILQFIHSAIHSFSF